MRLIDANELMRKVLLISHNLYVETFKPDALKMADEILDLISEEQVIDAEPVNHAEWVSMQNPNWPEHTHDMCSLCGWWNTKDSVCKGEKNMPIPLKYCPHCGANMMRR